VRTEYTVRVSADSLLMLSSPYTNIHKAMRLLKPLLRLVCQGVRFTGRDRRRVSHPEFEILEQVCRRQNVCC
jgi:hypothetical protein